MEKSLRLERNESEGLNRSLQALSDITVHTKYARYDEGLQRREVWDEIVDRNMRMHVKKYPKLRDQIIEAYEFVRRKEVLPSMRSMQFGGKPIELSPNRLYNCAYAPVNSWEVFPEIMFLLLGGTGVGYSVQRHHVSQLPEVRRPNKRRKRYLIGDSIEGWADAVKALLKSYFFGGPTISFDFSDIRPKGARLVTSGGKAPGPQPLKDCLHNLKKVLDEVPRGEKLTPLQVHDIVCYIADAVLAGGIRRAALLSLFSIDDEEMLTCKYGRWWELNPQRGRANNSACVIRHKVDEETFFALWERIKKSGSGEPGIYFSNNMEWGTNPCCEIGLRPFQFCNLTTINMATVRDQEDLNARAKAAAFIGTLQAGYTDFHYLRDVWQETTEKDALIGVSQTGIASVRQDLDLTQAARQVNKENRRVAKLIGINPAARKTAIKPEGTGSLVVGTTSGIHGGHSDWYIRRLRLGKNEAVCRYLEEKVPELMEDDFEKPHLQSILSLPIELPEGTILRSESALSLLERVKRYSQEWVRPGHAKGDNGHNVSATINVKDDEWDAVGLWMWHNREHYNGLSVLPYDGGSYTQMPFEAIGQETYERMMAYVADIDLTEVTELDDNTNLTGELACAGGQCSI